MKKQLKGTWSGEVNMKEQLKAAVSSQAWKREIHLYFESCWEQYICHPGAEKTDTACTCRKEKTAHVSGAAIREEQSYEGRTADSERGVRKWIKKGKRR